MENMKQVIQKVIASLIIFTMIMVQYAIVGFTAITYAIDMLSTQSENVQFKAYFVENDKETATIERSIENKDLKLNIDVSVKNEGYFNGTISLENAGFRIKDESIINNNVKEIKDNVIYLNQINAEDTAHIEVGIEFLNENEISTVSLNSETDVKLKGTYISSKKNNEIDATSKVLVNWNIPQNTKAEILSKILTNKIYTINQQNKRIVQFLVSSKLTNNSYPTKNTKLLISIPEGATNIEVHKRTTKATNGEKEFTQNNYKIENNTLEINVDNSETDGKISWIKDVQDVFVVTYEFDENKDLSNTNITVNGTITTFDKDATTGLDIAFNGEQSQVDLSKEKDGIISVMQEEKETSIYKGKIYSGENRDITSDTIVYVDYASAANEFTLTENAPVFTYEETDDEDNKNTITKESNVEYKSIKVNKVQLSAVLGDTWNLKIGDKVITNETQSEENGDIIIALNQGTKTVDIEASKPLNNGAFLIESTKTLLKTEYTRDEIKQFTNLEDSSSVQYTKYDNSIHKYTHSFIMNLKETESKADFKCEQQALMTNQEGQELDLTVVLESKNESQDLYKNPTLKIKLPSQIKSITYSQKPQLMYENGLTLTDENYTIVEEGGQKVLKVVLTGEQTKYFGEVVQGTTVLIKTNVKLNENVQDSEEEIVLNYTNENATKYTDNGTQKLNVEIIARQNEEQNQEQNQNQNQNQQQNENTTNTGNNQAQSSDIKVEITAKVGGETINSGDIVRTGEIITYTTKITNTGSTDKTGLIIEEKIPENTNLIEINPEYPTYDSRLEQFSDDRNYLVEKTDRSITKENVRIRAGETITLEYMVRVNTNLIEEKNIESEVLVKENNNIIERRTFSNKINKGYLQIEISPVFRRPEKELQAGKSYTDRICIKNLSNEEQTNVEITINKNATKINSISWFLSEERNGRLDNEKDTFNIESIPANETLEIIIDKAPLNIVDNVIMKESDTVVKVKDSRGNIYRSNELVEKIKGVIVKATGNAETSSKDNSGYVKIGDKIKYNITIENVGELDANNLYINDEISKYLTIEKVLLNNEECEYSIENLMLNDETYDLLSVKTSLKVGEKSTLEIISVVNSNLIESAKEDVQIINNAKIANDGEILSEIDEIRHILKINNKTDNTVPGDNSNNQNNNIDNKYTISGIAWIDSNEDGKRSSQEDTLSNVKVWLLDLKNNTITNIGATNSEGKYSISNLSKGEYAVIFEYDTNKYRLTTYHANNVSEIVNSDVGNVTMNINNKSTKVASTDKITINKGNIENIDIGLIEEKPVKLSLEKTISKITVSNAGGTRTIKYNNPSLAKVEIKSKYLKGSTVIIEYNITVKNVGDVAGYAKSIVDYIPSSLTFNSKLNKDWYKKDNKIYTTSLAKTKIKPGESKTVKLIMSKKMTESNTGLVNNKAEILSIYGSNGKKVTNVAGKDDKMGNADVIISVSTGTAISFLTITIAITLAIAIIVYYITMKKIKEITEI